MDEDRYDRQRRIWGEKGQARLQEAKILIAGAGGVGSEIIKNLALLGIGSLTIIDMDLIELSNLNRQLLFRKEDIGKYKAEIASKMAQEFNEEVKVQFFNKKLQDIPIEIYKDVDLFISALDNIPARIFLNQKAVLLKKPMIDGGSEGFYGHVQVVLPQITPCLLCHDIWSRSEEKFKCTYAVYPRTPLDCVLEGRDRFYLEFHRLPDSENEEDLERVYEYAVAHAKKYDITGISLNTVKDFVKGTVAALVTTNAVIGAVMTNECLKTLLKGVSVKDTELAPLRYYQFNGLTEAGWSIPLERNKDCPVCGIKQLDVQVPPLIPLLQFIQHLERQLTFELKAPLLLKEGVILYRDVSALKGKAIPLSELNRLKENEVKSVSEFFNDSESLFLQDEILGIELWINIKFTNQDQGGLA